MQSTRYPSFKISPFLNTIRTASRIFYGITYKIGAINKQEKYLPPT